MKNQRILVSQIGTPDQMHLIEEVLQKPQANQVMVKILTAGVAFADILIRYGDYPGVPKPPITPGYDLIGEVLWVGSEVSSVVSGDHVAALTVFGAYSRYINIPAEWLVKIPRGIDPIKAAALTLNYVTAYQMLHRIAKAQTGNKVLIHGASGGVGTALMQLGRLTNLEMIGTASRKNHAVLEKFGVTPIDYHSHDFSEILTTNPVDIVFESVGGTNLRKSLSVLKRGGKMIVYGARTSIQNQKFKKGVMLNSIVQSIFYNMIPNGKTVQFYAINARKDTSQFREDLSKLLELLKHGEIDPIIDSVYPLEQAAAANQKMENGVHQGKIILQCNPID